MRKTFLTLSVAAFCLTGCNGAAPVAFALVTGAGFAVNSENTGGVKSGGEAVKDIKDGVVNGYSQDKNTSHKLNP